MSTFYRIIFLICLCTSSVYATHLLGGEIRATNLSGQTYKISAQIYFDASPGGGPATEGQSSILVCFGDGNTAEVKRTSLTRLAGDQKDIAVGTYDINYTYPAAGTFQISTNITNRTGNLLNFDGSVNTGMFLWTVINTQIINTTPVLPVPIFTAGARQVFQIDLKPAGTDADSISAHLQKVSKTSPGTCGVRSINDTYLYPNDVSKKGTFSIDQMNKKLVWNAPDLQGIYIYAVVIDEWRDGVKISETYREGLITVTDKPGSTVEIPPYIPGGITGPVTGLPDSEGGNLSLLAEVFPVPTEDFLTVSVSSAAPTGLRVEVINLSGQIVRVIKTSEKQTLWSQQMDLRRLSKGMYIIRITDDEGKFITKKIVR
jgi:hypothetical protein